MKRYAVLLCLLILTPSAFAQPDQAVVVGPWGITTTTKAGKFDSCSMNRTTVGDLGISFVRGEDGLLLLLDLPKWKLERGKAYTVRLTAGGQSVEAQALAETKGVTIAVADRSFNARLRIANALEVQGEGATLHVPLADASLDEYEAYRRGDRFYVKLPATDVSQAAKLRARGFEDVTVQKSGGSTVLSFHLQPGTTARVDQKGNHLDVIFTTPKGAQGSLTTPSASNSVSPNAAGSLDNVNGSVPETAKGQSAEQQTPQTLNRKRVRIRLRPHRRSRNRQIKTLLIRRAPATPGLDLATGDPVLSSMRRWRN